MRRECYGYQTVSAWWIWACLWWQHMEPGLHKYSPTCKHAHCSHATLSLDLLGNANLFCLKEIEHSAFRKTSNSKKFLHHSWSTINKDKILQKRYKKKKRKRRLSLNSWDAKILLVSEARKWMREVTATELLGVISFHIISLLIIRSTRNLQSKTSQAFLVCQPGYVIVGMIDLLDRSRLVDALGNTFIFLLSWQMV